MTNGRFRLCLLLFGLLVLCGCPIKSNKEEDVASRIQLTQRAELFNQALRWRSYQRAKMLVAPGLRSSYMMQWERDDDIIRITDFAVRDISMIHEGKEALVLVIHTRYSANTASLKRVVFQQIWKASEGIWFYVGDKHPESAGDKQKQPTTREVKQPSN
jgi:hypothetical protein